MSVAQVEAFLQKPGFLEKAYLARKIGELDPDMHLAFLWLFHSVEAGWKEPDTVASNCAVQLQAPNREWWVVIGSDHLRAPGEHPPDDDLAKRLLGRKIGDRIVLREGREDLVYTIKNVQSKYVRAFQQTFEDFTSLFPSNPAISRISLGDGTDFTKMLALTDERTKFVTQVDQYYEEGKLPMASFARLVGRSTIEVWYGKTMADAGRVVTSCSSHEGC